MKSPSILLLALSSGHCVNDFIAGYMLHNLAGHQLLFVSVYGAIAFGGQLPLALLIDRFRDYKKWGQLAMLLNILVVAVAFVHLPFAIIIAGFASAIYHVSGGAMALRLETVYKGIALGAFSAPGIIGLTIGTVLPSGTEFPLLFVIPLLVFFTIIFRMSPDETATPGDNDEKQTADFDAHDVLMLLILLIAASRSAMWDIFQALSMENSYMLIWVAVAAAIGKLLGGFLASRFNTIHYLNFSMLLSVAFLHIADKSHVFLYAGITLLQSGIPGSIQVLGSYFPQKPAFASGSILGLAVFVGAVIYSVFPLAAGWFAIASVVLIIVLSAINARLGISAGRGRE